MGATSVLIAGAGPTGLVLAIDLARRGLVPRIIDAAPPDHRESRAVAIAARSLELLDDLDIAAAAIDRGIPLRAIEFREGSKTLAQLDVTAIGSPFPMDLCIPQWQTVALLRERAERLGVTVEWDTRLTALEPGADGVAVGITGPGGDERCETDWLIGCDGSHSTVRRAAGFGWETADLRRGFILGDVVAEWGLERDRFHAFFGKTGVVAVFPMPGGYWRILASTPNDRPPKDPGLADFAAYVAKQTPLDAGVRDLQWSSAFVAREGLVDRYRSGRILLAGDAAHSHSPVAGQGMNTGMQDAYNLGWKLALVASGRAPASLLDSYQNERRPVAAAVVETTSITTRVAAGRAAVVRRTRNEALRLFGRLNSVQQRLSNALGEYTVHYRDSDFVWQRWNGSKPRPWSNGTGTGPEAGDLARDAYVEGAAGPTAMRRLLRGTGHHLIVFAADTGDPETLTSWKAKAEAAVGDLGRVHLITRVHRPKTPEGGVFADPHDEAHDRYGVRRPSLYLIRPDKYIAYRSDTVDLDPIRDYFRALTAGGEGQPGHSR